MKTREYLIKGVCLIEKFCSFVKLIESQGNDPFDYEQKFPEDKRYEELGPTARVWRTYLEECAAFDVEMVEGWRDGLDVLLVFVSVYATKSNFLR